MEGEKLETIMWTTLRRILTVKESGKMKGDLGSRMIMAFFPL